MENKNKNLRPGAAKQKQKQAISKPQATMWKQLQKFLDTNEVGELKIKKEKVEGWDIEDYCYIVTISFANSEAVAFGRGATNLTTAIELLSEPLKLKEAQDGK